MAQKQPQKIDDTGWIKLHRKIQLNPLWTERRRFSRAEAWIDILMEARHDPEPAKILIGNQIIECKRGECIKSLDTWASRWKWNKSAVRRFFDLLQGMNQIRHENETKTTRLYVCNYDAYNGTRNADETQMKRKRNADETHLTPNKNDKNEENGKNEENPTAGAVLELPLDEPIKVPITDTFKGRIGAIFSRRASTAWTPKEIKALHALTITEDDMKLIEGFYGEPRASWQEPAPYLWKKDMLTLLNNWTSAIDRARGYVRPAGQSGPELVALAAKYIAADPADPYLSKSIQLKAKEMCGPKGFDMLLEEVAKQKRNAKPV
jgi:hypothetical protein